MDKGCKLIGTVIIWLVYFVILWFLYPHNTVELTLSQMSNKALTQETIEFQQLLWKLSWVIPLILTICIYFDWLCELILEIISNIFDD
jgi:hypothetical protein